MVQHTMIVHHILQSTCWGISAPH